MIPETANGIPGMESRCRETRPGRPGGGKKAVRKRECWSNRQKTIGDKTIRANMPNNMRIFVHFFTRACVAPELKLFPG